MDLLTGANCCRPLSFHFYLGDGSGKFGERRTVTVKPDVGDCSLEVGGKKESRPFLVDWNYDGQTDLVICLRSWRDKKHGFQIFVNSDLPKFDLTQTQISLPVLHAQTNIDNRLLWKLQEHKHLFEPELKLRDVNSDGLVDLLLSSPLAGDKDKWEIVAYINKNGKGDSRFAEADLGIQSGHPILGFDLIHHADGRASLVALDSSGFNTNVLPLFNRNSE